jgi:hypothetical protein
MLLARPFAIRMGGAAPQLLDAVQAQARLLGQGFLRELAVSRC